MLTGVDFFQAAMTGDTTNLEKLDVLTLRTVLMCSDANGRTPLHYAAMKNQLPFFKLAQERLDRESLKAVLLVREHFEGNTPAHSLPTLSLARFEFDTCPTENPIFTIYKEVGLECVENYVKRTGCGPFAKESPYDTAARHHLEKIREIFQESDRSLEESGVFILHDRE